MHIISINRSIPESVVSPGIALAMSAPTSAPTVSLASIQLQGNAMADIARAIPGLTTLSGMDR